MKQERTALYILGSGDNLSEQSRPLLQVEDIRAATGGEKALLESRNLDYFVVDVPNFWERPEMHDYLRGVRKKPDRYTYLNEVGAPPLSEDNDLDRMTVDIGTTDVTEIDARFFWTSKKRMAFIEVT